MRTSPGRCTSTICRVQMPASPALRRARARSEVTACRRASSPESSRSAVTPAAAARSAGRPSVQPARASTASTQLGRSARPTASESGVARARAAAAEALDLSLEPLDLRALLGATEGVAIDTQRIAAASEPLVGIAEVLDDGRIFAGELHGALELLDGALVLAA